MLLPLLALLAANRPLPKLRPHEAAGIAQDLRSNPDAPALVALPGTARRDGRVLGIGDWQLVDEGAACDGSGCVRYRFDRLWPGGLAGVKVGSDENSDYLLLGTKTAFMEYVGGEPHSSPSSRYFFTGVGSEINDESVGGVLNGSYIWRSADGVRLRTVDDATVHPTSFIAWHGDDCVEFEGFPQADIAQGEHRFWLVRDPLDWTLHDRLPETCSAP